MQLRQTKHASNALGICFIQLNVLIQPALLACRFVEEQVVICRFTAHNLARSSDLESLSCCLFCLYLRFCLALWHLSYHQSLAALD